MASGGSAIHENILANMADGVLTLDLQGRIVTCNAAAVRILKLGPGHVAGRTFAELFLVDPGHEALNELVLKAIYEAETTHSEEVEVLLGGERKRLSVSTTFLLGGPEASGERRGVIVVFSDVTERAHRQRIEQLFGEYVDPRIVELLQRLDERPFEAGRRQEMSVMFTDMERFTALGDRLDAERVVMLLNTYLTEMARPIGGSRGITDKYIGDAVMAFWGPPFTGPGSHAAHACAAALEQRARLPELRRAYAGAFPGHDFARFEVRTGIATGEVIAGSIGSSRAKNYTIIGTPVNVAARLERANKTFRTRILVAEETRQAAQDDFEFRELDLVRLDGLAEPRRVFELLGPRGALPAERSRLRDCFEAGLRAYRAGETEVARARFEACAEGDPQDRPTRLFLERLDRLERQRRGAQAGPEPPGSRPPRQR